MTTKLKRVTTPRAIRCVSRIVGQVEAGTGIEVDHSGGVFTVNSPWTASVADLSVADISNNNNGTVTITGTDPTGTTAHIKFYVNGTTHQGAIDFYDEYVNIGASTGMYMRWWAKDTTQTLQAAAVINPGLIDSTAGSWKGDIDFLTYKNTFGEVGFHCAMNSELGGQFSPVFDNLYLLGNDVEPQRWKEVNGVTGKFETVAISKTQNAGTYLSVVNGSSGASAYSGIIIDSNSVEMILRSFSSGAGGGAQLIANDSIFIDAQHASGTVITRVGAGPTAVTTVSTTGFSIAGTDTVTSASANALTVGRQGATDPVLQVDASTGSVATGLKLKGAAAAGGMAVSVISSGTNEALTIDAKGTGTITLGGTSTGGITLSRALTYGGVTLNNAVVGTGNMVLSTSPSLTTPALGTPSSGTLTNCTGYTVANLSDTAWSSFSPTVTAATGTITTVGTIVAAFKTSGKTTHWRAKIPITTNGTGATRLIMTLPANDAGVIGSGFASGFNVTSLKSIIGWYRADAANSVSFVLSSTDGYPCTSGDTMYLAGSYESA